jgi:hypothetical protein
MRGTDELRHLELSLHYASLALYRHKEPLEVDGALLRNKEPLYLGSIWMLSRRGLT